MKSVRNLSAVLAVAILAIGRMAFADAMSQVPADSLAVFKVADLEVTSKKIADFCGTLGIVQMDPELSDPLGAYLKWSGITDGFNRSGDMAVAYLDPAVFVAANDESVLVLFPISDYAKFIGNFADAKPDGDLTQTHFKNDPGTLIYIAHWGDYAAASPVRDIVAKPPTDVIQVQGLAAKELDAKDFVLMGNFKALRPKLLDLIAKAREQASAQIDEQIQKNPAKLGNVDPAKLAPLAKVVVTQFLNVAEEFATDTDAATLSANLSPEGIGTTLMGEFQPDSAVGKLVVQTKNTDASLLAGLADDKYLLYGGSLMDPKQMAQSVSDFLGPIQVAITALGPDYTSVNDWLVAFQKTVSASAGGTFGMFMPTATPGQGSLVQFEQIRRGDAKAMLDAMHDMLNAQQTAIKVLGFQWPGTDQTMTPAAKTVDGVTFDELQTGFNPNPNSVTPQQQQMKMAMTMMYGPQGPTVYTGILDDQTLLSVMGLDDAAISKAIAAIKAGDDPMARTSGVKTVAAQLPTDRLAVVYFPLDLWASAGLGYAKQFGMDMGVTLPDNLPPIGTTFSTDGSAVRVDSYIPAQLVQALTAAGIQVYMKTQQPANGGGGGGGGL
jgi:hypothetical protein